MQPWRAHRSPIGLDIGSGSIKAAQLVGGPRGWRLAAAANYERREQSEGLSTAEVGRLLEVLERAGFEGSDVVVGAPRERLLSAVLELPPKKSGAPIEQICEAEAVRLFRLTPGAYELHTWEMPTLSARANSTQMAATALPWDSARALVDPFEEVGLYVEAIDITPEATSRCCGAMMEGLAELSVLIDIGFSGLDVIVFREGVRVYQRRLEGIGGDAMVRELSRKLVLPERSAGAVVRHFGLCDAEDAPPVEDVALARARVIMREQTDLMLRGVLSSVAYALDRFPGESVTAIRLTGGGAGLLGLAPYLSEISGLDVRVLGVPFRGRRGSRGLMPPASRCLTAIGHALWRVGA